MSAAHELAGELRAVIEAMVTSQPSDEDLAEAVELARTLRARLQGPPARRWYEVSEHIVGSAQTHDAFVEHSLLRGLANPLAPPLRLEVVALPDGRPGVEGRVTLGMAYEGPPHSVHGGYVAALFDELLGSAQHLGEVHGLTARLTVRYRALTPVGEELVLRGWIEEVSGRRLTARATCHARDTLTAEAEALFVAVDFGRLRDREE